MTNIFNKNLKTMTNKFSYNLKKTCCSSVVKVKDPFNEERYFSFKEFHQSNDAYTLTSINDLFVVSDITLFSSINRYLR